MVKVFVMQTDGANTSGTAKDRLTGLSFMQFNHGIAIVDLIQPSSGTVANDADWTLYIDGKETDYFFQAEMLDPSNIGRIKLTSPIRIAPGRKIQWKWSGQAAAALNNLYVYYEII
jgi:hypothetical protein